MGDQRAAHALYNDCQDVEEYNRIRRAVCNRVGWGIKHAREVANVMDLFNRACKEQAGIEGYKGATQKALAWSYYVLPYDKHLMVKAFILSFSNTNEFDCPAVYSGEW